MHTTQAGIDIAKAVFEVALSDTPGTVGERHRLSRARFRRFFAERQATTVLMEACGSAHYWGRELEAMGHRVRLLHPGDVARYRDGNKTDRADAKAVLEAARNAAIDPVPVKSQEQQAIAALHRMRQGYLQTRTARINAVRGHLREFGIVIPVGARHVVARAESALATTELPDVLRRALADLLAEIEELQAKAEHLRSQLEHLAKTMPEASVLMSVPGIGVLTATALVAFVGDLNRFRSGRDLAAYLGLTPREHSSGHTRRLGRITKRGNSYVRMMLIHGARSALRAGSMANAPDDIRTWALAIKQRRGFNVAAVALANKLARVCWRVWHDQRPFQRREAA
jgi:transposase